MYTKSEFVLPDRQKLVADVHETEKGKVSIYVNTWFAQPPKKGKPKEDDRVLIDFRRYYCNRDGKWLPTGKGFSVPMEEEVIISMLKAMANLAESVGLDVQDVLDLKPQPQGWKPPANPIAKKLAEESKRAKKTNLLVEDDEDEELEEEDYVPPKRSAPPARKRQPEPEDDLDDLEDELEVGEIESDLDLDDLEDDLEDLPPPRSKKPTPGATVASRKPIPVSKTRGFSRVKARD